MGDSSPAQIRTCRVHRRSGTPYCHEKSHVQYSITCSKKVPTKKLAIRHSRNMHTGFDSVLVQFIFHTVALYGTAVLVLTVSAKDWAKYCDIPKPTRTPTQASTGIGLTMISFPVALESAAALSPKLMGVGPWTSNCPMARNSGWEEIQCRSIKAWDGMHDPLIFPDNLMSPYTSQSTKSPQ